MIRISDQARENREYARRLLKEKQPGFAALLEPAERLLCPMCLARGVSWQPRREVPQAV